MGGYNERKKNSKKECKKKRFRKLMLFAIILLLLYLFVFKTDYFNIKTIKVSGNKKLSYDKIVKASLCKKGENIFKVDISNGEDSLLRLPYIKSCNIKRNFPNKITIEVQEREETGILSYNNQFAYIDKDGYILSIREKSGEVSLPIIFGLENFKLEEGDNLYEIVDNNNIEEFIRYGNELNVLGVMKYINLTDIDNAKIQLNNDIKVAFGPFNNVKYKLRFLDKILEDINNKNIKANQILFNKGDNPIIVIDNR